MTLLFFSFGPIVSVMVVTRFYVPFLCHVSVCSICCAFHLFCTGALFSKDGSPPLPLDWSSASEPCLSHSIILTSYFSTTRWLFVFVLSNVTPRGNVVHCHNLQLLLSMLSWLVTCLMYSLGPLTINCFFVLGLASTSSHSFHSASLTFNTFLASG
jgi:hypothetical protein